MAFEYLGAYATFESVADMDKSVEDHMAVHYFNLTKSERAVVFAIQTSALAYPGACHLKNETISKEIGVSLITVSRAISKLVKLGIIGKANRTKKNGIKGANIYFFLPHNDVSEMMQRATVDEADNNAVCPPQSENQSFSSFNLLNSSNTLDTSKQVIVDKEVVKEVEEVKMDIKRGLRDKMPTYIYDLLAPYLNLNDLYEAYGTLARGKASIDRTITFETYEGLYRDAILSVINAYKRGVVHNLFAVLYTAVKDTTAQIYRKENYNVPDWLAN